MVASGTSLGGLQLLPLQLIYKNPSLHQWQLSNRQITATIAIKLFIILSILLFITLGVVCLWPSAMTIVDNYHYDDDDLLYLIYHQCNRH